MGRKESNQTNKVFYSLCESVSLNAILAWDRLTTNKDLSDPEYTCIDIVYICLHAYMNKILFKPTNNEHTTIHLTALGVIWMC